MSSVGHAAEDESESATAQHDSRRENASSVSGRKVSEKRKRLVGARERVSEKMVAGEE